MKKDWICDYLKKYINQIRDMRKYTIKSDDMDEESLYYLQEGYREGLCAAAMMLADELDAEYSDLNEDGDRIYEETDYLNEEEQWWHTHNDEQGDIGSDERL